MSSTFFPTLAAAIEHAAKADPTLGFRFVSDDGVPGFGSTTTSEASFSYTALERASARETAARVAAGALSRCLLREFGIDVFGYVVSIGTATSTVNFNEPLDELERLTSHPAHQRGLGNLVWQSLVHPGRDLGRRNESVVDFPRPDQGRPPGRSKTHGQKHTYW